MKERLDKLVKIYDVRTIVMVFLGMLFIAIYVWMALSSKVADVRFNNEEATLLRDGWTVCVNGSSQEVPEIYVGTKASFIYMVLEQAKASLMLVLPVLILGIGLCIIFMFPTGTGVFHSISLNL